ncbi:hypothetical protein ABIC74_000259 [Mucilaginibacter rubeus]
MENATVNYYCFNKKCSVSIYNQETVLTLSLQFNEKTLAVSHHCTLCGSPLISKIDLLVRKLTMKGAGASNSLIS